MWEELGSEGCKLWEELGSAVTNLLSRRKIVGHEPNYGGDGYQWETPFVEVSLQRFQNELKKIVEGATSFNVYDLAVAHDRLITPANRLATAAKNFAQSV